MDVSGRDQSRLYRFGPFSLDPRERVLFYEGRPVALTPKTFDVLLLLVEKSGHIVSKEELMERVWPDTFVEEMNLARHVSTLRKTLSEHDGEAEYIETVPKRGYRFKGAETVSPNEAAAPLREERAGAALYRKAARLKPRDRHTVGREDELSELSEAFDTAAEGRGMIFCVTGEPGIGKTTLIEEFLAHLSATRECVVARGRCSERLAGAEAYLPFIEALESLIAGDASDGVSDLMKQTAPNWYAQILPLSPSGANEQVPSDFRAFSQAWLTRELGNFFQSVTSDHPLVLFLDNLHWADVSTVDLLAYIAGRLERMRMLIVASYRSSELLLNKHPFLRIKLDLQARGLCREIALPFLTRDDIARYLDMEFPGNRFPTEFSGLIHVKTEGSPLFMVDVVRYLGDRGVIEREEEGWILTESVPDVERDLPESVRSMIQRKIEQLGDGDRRLLMAASVQGREFDSAVLEAVAGMGGAEVEERLEELDKVYAFVRLAGERELPDLAVSLRYRFVHALYQNAFFDSLRPTRKASLSARVAETILGHYGAQATEIASELAMLFKGARDFRRAAEFFLAAAQNSLRVFANQEAIHFCLNAIDMLDRLSRGQQGPGAELSALRARAQETLGDVYRIIVSLEDARASYEEALASTPDSDLLSRSRLRRKIGNTWQIQRNNQEALRSFDLAEAALGEPPEKDHDMWRQEWIAIQLDRIWNYYWQGRIEEMHEQVEKTGRFIESYGSQVQRGKFYDVLALYHLRRDRFVTSAETLDYAHKARDRIKDTDDVGEKINIGFLNGFAALWAGDFDDAEAQFKDVLSTSDRRGDREHQVLCLTYLTLSFRMRGMVEETQRYLELAREAADEAQMADYIGMADANRCWLAYHRGDYTEAERLGLSALMHLHATYPFKWAGLWPLIAIALANDKVAAAAEHARALLDSAQQRLPDELSTVLENAISACGRDSTDEARALLKDAVELAAEMNYL